MDRPAPASSTPAPRSARGPRGREGGTGGGLLERDPAGRVSPTSSREEHRTSSASQGWLPRDRLGRRAAGPETLRCWPNWVSSIVPSSTGPTPPTAGRSQAAGTRPRHVGALSLRRCRSSLTLQDIGAILDTSFDIAVRPGLHCALHIHRALGTFLDGNAPPQPRSVHHGCRYREFPPRAERKPPRGCCECRAMGERRIR